MIKKYFNLKIYFFFYIFAFYVFILSFFINKNTNFIQIKIFLR